MCEGNNVSLDRCPQQSDCALGLPTHLPPEQWLLLSLQAISGGAWQTAPENQPARRAQEFIHRPGTNCVSLQISALGWVFKEIFTDVLYSVCSRNSSNQLYHAEDNFASE